MDFGELVCGSESIYFIFDLRITDKWNLTFTLIFLYNNVLIGILQSYE